MEIVCQIIRRNMIIKRRIYRKTEAVLRLIFHRQGEGQHFVVSIRIAFRCVREMSRMNIEEEDKRQA